MMRSAICRSKIDGLRKLQFVIETASALLLGINKVINISFGSFKQYDYTQKFCDTGDQQKHGPDMNATLPQEED